MKKTLNGIGYNKSRARLVAKSKAENVIEAQIRAKKNIATKAIIIGSAALSVVALGIFAFDKYKKKKKGLSSLWD